MMGIGGTSTDLVRGRETYHRAPDRYTMKASTALETARDLSRCTAPSTGVEVSIELTHLKFVSVPSPTLLQA